MESNPLTGLLGLLMLLQLAVVLMILLGGLYALYCLNRAAAGLDRLASAVESWVAQAATAQTATAQVPTDAQNQVLPAPVPANNADWLQPIELPNAVAASNQSSEAVSSTPARASGESEVRRD
jgi:hypothetical protein